MSSSHSVQLGAFHIDLDKGHDFPFTDNEWLELDLQILRSGIWLSHERRIIETLRFALADEGLGFSATCRRQVDQLVVRVALLPSDAPGSRWKRVKSWDRRKYLERLFLRLRKGYDGWGDPLMGRTAEDDNKMADIYASIPSPPIPSFPSSSMATDEDTYRRLEEYDNPEGVRTPLYQYQHRSVAKMLRMETQPGRLVDPLWTPFEESGLQGTYYVNLATWDIQRHPGWYDLPRGGILCEQMGTGKTLMCLSLIVSTLHQTCKPPSNIIEISPATTENAERTYPFEANAQLRETTGFPLSETRLAIPSLLDLSANILALNDHSFRRVPDLPSSAETLLFGKTFYYHFPLVNDCMRQAKRSAISQQVKRVCLANSTLVVVPGILIQQWKDEMEKHVDQGVLRVLEVGKEPLPNIDELLGYDVIIMDVARFGREESLRRKELKLEPSVLLSARWKRIILDEGHVAGDKTSNAMRLAMALSVERRWLVSGTPTRHLQQGGEIDMGTMVLPEPLETLEARVCPPNKREWSNKDEDDGSRIGVMIGGFLAAEPFRSEAGFQGRVTSKLRGPDGPEFGAVQRMKYIMGATMVKHGPKIIDQEASLPPSSLSTELLQFHPMQRITYNVLASLIASNVYTSDFEDIDYFLHPRNASEFRQVVRNLHLACFWYSARDMGVAECLNRSRVHLTENQGMTDEGKHALAEAISHLKRALDAPGWQEWMMNGVSIPFGADEWFPLAVRRAWSDSMKEDPDAIDAHSLELLRRANTNGKEDRDLLIAGEEHKARKWSDEVEEMEKAEMRAARDAKQTTGQAAAANAPTAAPKVSPRKGSAKRSRQNEERIDEQLAEAAMNAARQVLPPRRSDLPRPLPSIIHIKSRSAKQNFVVDAILTAEPSDKFVIFGDIFEFGHLSEALDLFDVKYCFAGLNIPVAARHKALKDFEAPDMRVILLDLKLGARGLNLVVANRMIFLSPVWSLDVQAQAIKRIHRIGQTRPTKVQILVIEGTFEEDIAKRASNARSEVEEQMYSRAMIESPRFVYPESEGSKIFAARFVPLEEVTPPPASPRASTPTDTSPTTPLARKTLDYVTVVSPSPIPNPVNVDRIEVAPVLQRQAKDAEGGSKKKRVRVAFA